MAQIAAKLVGYFENLIIFVPGNSAQKMHYPDVFPYGFHHRITLYVLQQQLLLGHSAPRHRPS